MVIAPLDKGRQGVRLDEPYASKQLNLKVTSLTGIGAPEDDDDDDDDDEEEEDEDTGALAAALRRGARIRISPVMCVHSDCLSQRRPERRRWH